MFYKKENIVNELLFIGFILVDMLLMLLTFKFFGKSGLIAFYVSHILLVQMTIKLQVDLFGFTAVIGSMLYAVLFATTDILTEHYGKKAGYKAVLLGALCLGVFIFVVNVANAFSPSSTDISKPLFTGLFAGQWRITLSDLMIGILAGQLFDVWFFHKIEEWTKGKYLWLRNNGSTFISQTIVAVLFFQCAFAGVIEQSVLWQIIWVGLVMKIFIAFIDTPCLYLSYKFVPKGTKKHRVDYIVE